LAFNKNLYTWEQLTLLGLYGLNHSCWKKCLVVVFIAFILLGTNSAVADDGKVAIFFPKAQEPYKSIYQEIIAGSRNAANEHDGKVDVEQFILDKNSSSVKIIQELEQKKIKKVIVLGRAGWKLAKKLSKLESELSIDKTNQLKTKKFNVVSGALPITPNGISGISLITDPLYLFKYLGQVAPQVKNIHVAYSKKSAWLIKLATEAAKEQGLKLNSKEVKDTKEAIRFYQSLFDSGASQRDALWLPLDKISSHDKITLPLILEKAWAKEIVVFSSKPSHAKRGALFSTYPDNFSLGKHLFAMVHDLDKQPNEKQFATLKSTLLAVNLRTAAHLGLKYSAKQQQQFKLTFPE